MDERVTTHHASMSPGTRRRVDLRADSQLITTHHTHTPVTHNHSPHTTTRHTHTTHHTQPLTAHNHSPRKHGPRHHTHATHHASMAPGTRRRVDLKADSQLITTLTTHTPLTTHSAHNHSPYTLTTHHSHTTNTHTTHTPLTHQSPRTTFTRLTTQAWPQGPGGEWTSKPTAS